MPDESMSSQSPSSELNGRSKSGTSLSSEAPSNEPENKLNGTWQKFKQKYLDFTMSLEEYLDQVEAFGISFEDLPLYLTFLETSLKASEEARARERAESLEGRSEMIDTIGVLSADKARLEKERDLWRISTITLGGIVVIGLTVAGIIIAN